MKSSSRSRTRSASPTALLLIPLFITAFGGFVTYVVWGTTVGQAQVEYSLNPYSQIFLNNGNNFTQTVYMKNVGGGAAVLNIVLSASNGATVCNGGGACLEQVRMDQNTPLTIFSFNVHVPQNTSSFKISLEVQRAGSFLDFGNTFGQYNLEGASSFTYALASQNQYIQKQG